MRGMAIILGIILIMLGILGMFPEMTKDQLLFNIFKVNWAVNVLFLLSGIFGIGIGFFSVHGCRLYFEVIGIFYAIWAILGFIYQSNPLFGWIANNMGTAWLLAIIAVFCLILGFSSSQKSEIK
jgi:hypothetical protein